ncbi:hypothetical protein [Ramlibacter pallidus]|uniref:Uncharacterized protein n=1 Tax=Ramlibacter pallidus TaxID=2780087 RepID=A0ABR9S0Z1_9BURK|nr:hypothetical protein [Ramlibacter pallidus]MBE7367180.1 hypothetical protein [Ramlibacter pallidus]
MTSIDPSHQLAALLRKQVSAVRDGGAKAGPAGSPARAERAQSDAASVAAGRIQALSPNDPDRKKKALRIFLESVLLQELGAQLVHDPSFPNMVDAVQGQMQADSQMAAAADELSELLVAGATRK